jgi:hypothetical protein
MNKLLKTLMVLTVTGVTSFALPINITTYDGEGSGTGWYGTNEDQEVSNGCVTGQNWDVEAFVLDGTKLSLFGGYNFVTGERDNYRNLTFTSGDIFLDIDGDARYGSSISSSNNNRDGYQTVRNNNGWDYVLDLDMQNLSYNIYGLTDQSLVETVYFSQNADANPWRYTSGGGFVGNGIITYATMLTDSQTGLRGGYHNQLTVDLSFLGSTSFTAHYTMGCGNDNIIGQGVVDVPEPGLLGLVALGILFLPFVNKRKKTN